MTYTREQINELLNTNDRAVERAIIRLFELQNADEQQWGTTNTQNGRGFCSSDARAGTRFARWLQGMDNKNVVRYAKKSLNNPRAMGIFGKYCQNGGTVMDRARKIALKHSAQLVIIANEKAAAKCPDTGLTQTEKDEMNRQTRERLGPNWETVNGSVFPINTQSPGGECKGDGGSLSGPQPGTWAHTARMMAAGDDSGFDWDAWKDQMKEGR